MSTYNPIPPGLCQCGCGKATTKYTRSRPKLGYIQGEYRLYQLGHNNMRHRCAVAGAPTPEYSAWLAMKDRCRNPNNPRYKNYGGRGIQVCASWGVSFESFLKDVGPRPGPEYSLDRINVHEGYTKDNVRWATLAQQHSNTTRSVLVEYRGQRMTLTDACRLVGIDRDTAGYRLKQGWSLEEALHRTVRSCGPKEKRREHVA